MHLEPDLPQAPQADLFEIAKMEEGAHELTTFEATPENSEVIDRRDH